MRNWGWVCLVSMQYIEAASWTTSRAFCHPKQRFHHINHHLAHALSSYCMSGFDEVAVLIIDGRGAHVKQQRSGMLRAGR